MAQGTGWALLDPNPARTDSSLYAVLVPGPKIAICAVRGTSCVQIDVDPADVVRFAYALHELAADAMKMMVQQPTEGS